MLFTEHTSVHTHIEIPIKLYPKFIHKLAILRISVIVYNLKSFK